MKPIHKAIRISIVAIATVALTIWGFHFLKGTNLLHRTTRYFAVYSRIGGLQVSAPVTINGYKVGLVGDIAYLNNRNGSLLVTLEIDPTVKIPRGTVSKIFTSDLMAAKSITLEMTQTGSWHVPGDTLASEIELDLKEEVNAQVAPLKARIEKLMRSFDSVLVGFQAVFNHQTRENIIGSFQSISSTLNRINHTASQLDELVTSEKGKLTQILDHVEGITGSINRHSGELEATLHNFHLISDTLAKANLAATIHEANQSLAQVARLLEGVNQGKGSLGLLVNDDQLYRNLESTSKHLDELFRDMKSNPKRYVNFSLFDFNRSTGNGKKSKGTQSRELVEETGMAPYHVQLLASRKFHPLTEFPDSLQVSYFQEAGLYKYRTGRFAGLDEAVQFMQVLKGQYPDAFVVRSPEPN